MDTNSAIREWKIEDRRWKKVLSHPLFSIFYFRFLKPCLFVVFILILSARAVEPNFSSSTNVAKKARIVIVENSKVTKHFLPQPNEIPSMVERGLTKFTGK